MMNVVKLAKTAQEIGDLADWLDACVDELGFLLLDPRGAGMDEQSYRAFIRLAKATAPDVAAEYRKVKRVKGRVVSTQRRRYVEPAE